MTTFGQHLRTLRRAAGKTLGDVARATGVSVSFVSDVEHGRRRAFTGDRLAAIEALLGVADDSLRRAAFEERDGKIVIEASTPEAMEVGGMLMRGMLNKLSPQELEAMMAILRKHDDSSKESASIAGKPPRKGKG